MEPALGWTLLSREHLRRAEAQLQDESQQGVRDELGFLNIHQGYADRFFPGTSVLHTRLRYVLFVPWIYQECLHDRHVLDLAKAVEQRELRLTKRLNAARSDEAGIIGKRNYPYPTAQPPSMVYWTALGAWRLLRPGPDGTVPLRKDVNRSLKRLREHSRGRDDDDQPLDEGEPLFVELPDPPPEWRNDAVPETFGLRPNERNYLRKILLSVHRPAFSGQSSQSLLSRLVENEFVPAENSSMFDREVIAAAEDEDKAALHRAEQAASLAAIGRAVYAALLENRCEAEGTGLGASSNRHRNHLHQIVAVHRQKAADLDLTDLKADVPGLDADLMSVLRETQRLLDQVQDEYPDLKRTYEAAERRRKGRRARLSDTLMAKERRMEWDPAKFSLAEPLQYRWRVVKQHLWDLLGHS